MQLFPFEHGKTVFGFRNLIAFGNGVEGPFFFFFVNKVLVVLSFDFFLL